MDNFLQFVIDNKISVICEGDYNFWTLEDGEKYNSPYTIVFDGTRISGCKSLEDALFKAKEIIDNVNINKC